MIRLRQDELKERLIAIAAWRLQGRPEDDPRSQFTGIDFSGANMDRCRFTDANMNACLFDCWFDGAKMNDCWFDGAKMNDCWFDGAKMNDCRFDGAKMDNCWFYGATMDDCRFTDVTMNGCSFGGANMNDCQFDRATMDTATSINLITVLSPPVIIDIDKAIHHAFANGGYKLNMSHWHSCGTTHCRAGMAIHLAGEAGYAIEKQVGSWLAGKLIYEVSRPGPAPDFYANNKDAWNDILLCAGKEPKQ